MPIHTSLKSLKLYYGKGSYSASYYKIYIFYKMQKKKGSFHAVQWKQRRLCLMKVNKYVKFKSYWSDHSKLAMLSWKVSSQWSSIAKPKLLKLNKWAHAILIMLINSSSFPIKKGLNQIMCKQGSKWSFTRLICKSSWL